LSAESRYTIVSAQKNGRLAILHPRITFARAAGLAARRAIFLLPGAAILFAAGPAPAQETIFIGGSGQSSVEINLGVLEYRAAPRRIATVLQHPGLAAQGGLAPVVLRPPPEGPAAAAPRKKSSEPVKMAAKTEAVATSDMAAPKLKAPEPEPMPEAMPEPEPMPEPMPEPAPAAAAEKPVEEMTAEEYDAARKRNSNQVSSTSFAEDAALDSASAAPAESKPKAEKKPAKPAAAPKAAETKIAALDPADAPKAPGDAMQILFPAGESVLPQGAQASLAAVAARLGQDETLRLQLKAYAGGGADAASHARRLSLSRALSVRSELIEQGVRSTRIDVRALGNKSESGVSDRVDVILVKR